MYKPQKLLSIDLDAPFVPVAPPDLGGRGVIPGVPGAPDLDPQVPGGPALVQDRATVFPVLAVLSTCLVALFLFNQYYRGRSRPRKKRPRPRKRQLRVKMSGV